MNEIFSNSIAALILIAQTSFAEPMKDAKINEVDIFIQYDFACILEFHDSTGKASVDVIKTRPEVGSDETINQKIKHLKSLKKIDKGIMGLLVYGNVSKFSIRIFSEGFGRDTITRHSAYNINHIRKWIYSSWE